jgi:hypothetical protein
MFPVSVKGSPCRGGRVLLLRNERDERELLGGKLEVGEHPADCVVRGLFDPGEVAGMVMPEGYKRPVAAWFARLSVDSVG